MSTLPLKHPSVRLWLWGMWSLVACMVAVGGITRLTGSGLSMVEWHPLMGAVPPMGEADWERTFELYRQSPQYQQVNHWMGLPDFKRIFFWEFTHRLLGRLIGFAFAVPWLYFIVRGRLRGSWIGKTLIALLLGGGQGLLGWYMVKSGLVNEPQVSHLRLAAHLLLAFAVGQWVLWLALEQGPAQPAARSSVAPWAWLLVGLTALQSGYGALMAGTRAGLLYSSFPDMAGGYLPGPFFLRRSVMDDLLNGPPAIHWVHRMLAWLVLLLALWVGVAARRAAPPGARLRAELLLLAAALQFGLGAATVLGGVPVPIAVAHQLGAYLLLSCAVTLCHGQRPTGSEDAS